MRSSNFKYVLQKNYNIYIFVPKYAFYKDTSILVL